MTKIAKLTKSLRERIRSGEWGQEQSLPTRLLLSEEYGVAPGTISQVFRNLEQEGLVRILPRKGVIITDTQPTSQPSESGAAIGLRGSYVRMGVPGKEGYSGFIVNQLLEAAQEQGVPVLILQKREGEEPLTRERCEDLGLHGIIYLGGDCGEEARQLCMEGFPVISGNRPLERSPINYVDCDHLALIHDAVRRYASAGHRRISVLLPPTHVFGLLDKLKPHFIDSLLSNKIQYDITPYWVSMTPNGSHAEWSKQIDALFELDQPPTAFLCWTGLIVRLLSAVLDRRCLEVPKDVSIVYTPSNISAFPDISGFSYEGQNFGKKLLDGVMAKIRNPFHFIQDELPFDFIDKGSIAPPPGSTPP